jgi:predicted phosphate transport protein (TIGR00153 family)
LEGNLNFSFIPGEVKFYDFFEKASTNLLEGARLLQQILDDVDNLDEKVAQMTEIEHQGDFIVHEVTSLLPRSLITPIDPDDIQRLVSSLDDAVDAMHAASVRMSIYQITEIRKPARRLGNLIVEGAQELDLAIHALRDKKKYKEIRERIVQINTIENNGDRVMEEGLKSLVSHRDDVFDFIRWKEIYELLEAATDRIEDAGDVIQKVLIENA